MREKQVNIIGRGRGAKLGLTADGEKWAVNAYHHGVDAIFNMHDYKNNPTSKWDKAEATAKKLDIPIIDLENYPIEIMRLYFKTNNFQNSICYMLALGIFKRFKSIALWGCRIRKNKQGITDFEIPDHPGVPFWIGIAIGTGIDVFINGISVDNLSIGGELYGYANR